MKNLYILLFLIVFAPSCKGQNAKNSPKDSVDTYRNKLKNTPIPHFYGIKPDISLQVSEYIRRILQDRNGNIWFGTNGDGVARFSGKALVYFTMRDGLSGTAVRGVFEDKEGNIWFGTDCGVSKYNGKTFVNFTTKEGLDDNDVWSLYGDKAGNIWVGTQKGVSKYNPSDKANEKPFKHFQMPLPEVQNPKPVFSQKLVWCFLEDKAGNMWFGTNGLGLYKYNGKTFVNFTEKEGLCDNVVSCTLEDKNGNLWFGTRFGGVSRYDGKSFTNFTTNDGLSSNFVHTIMEDKTGNIWLSALGGGICRYGPSAGSKSFTNYAAKDGLTNLYVQSILEDKSGRLWFGSGAGLFRFDGITFFNVTKEGLILGCQ